MSIVFYKLTHDLRIIRKRWGRLDESLFLLFYKALKIISNSDSICNLLIEQNLIPSNLNA